MLFRSLARLRLAQFAPEPIQIEPGVILPAGTYTATEGQTGVYLRGKLNWGNPDYHIELSAEQLAEMGVKTSQGLISAEIPLTKFVRSGHLKVT